LQFSAKAAIQTASMMFSILRRKVASPSYSAGLEFELTGVAQSVELA
jgi:hypothetical protein